VAFLYPPSIVGCGYEKGLMYDMREQEDDSSKLIGAPSGFCIKVNLHAGQSA